MVWGCCKEFCERSKGSDRDRVKAIAASQGDIAIVNSYYVVCCWPRKRRGNKCGKAVSVFFPNQGDGERGAHINVSGIALAKNAQIKKMRLSW